jgi:hypothetical protein
MADTKCKIPQIGDFVRGVGTLVDVQTEEPTPPKKDYIFENIDSKCELRRNGKVLDELGTYNDYYGLGTGVKTAIKEMKEYCKEEVITSASEVEVVILMQVSQVRMRPIGRENFYTKEWIEFQSLDWGSKRDLPEPTEEIVWSSKKDL